MLERIFSLLKIPAMLSGNVYDRVEPCCICGEKKGMKIGTVDFWDLQEAILVKCQKCSNVQLDPKLTNRNTETGCQAYYYFEKQQTSSRELQRNMIRNYRRGVLFAYQLKKKGFNPQSLLELGPGSGYFASGIQGIFPGCKVTVMDVVDEVLNKNRNDHEFETIKGTIEDGIICGEKQFDLIIARDILEHVNDVSAAIEQVSTCLKEGGYFHFLTPNGHEDVWGHYLFWKKYHKPSELLINHVNYFDGRGLLDLLNHHQLEAVHYFTFRFKTTLRGKGWSRKHKLQAQGSEQRSAEKMISASLQSGFREDETNLRRPWYFQKKFRRIGIFLAFYHHCIFLKLPPQYNLGHEIYGLFKKRKSQNQ